MSRIKSIVTDKFRATGDTKLNLNGASCIVTAKNNLGKTSLLRGLFDRVWGEKPELIMNRTEAEAGAKSGSYMLELTDGAKIEWSFTPKTEKLVYFDPRGQKTTTGVISLLQEKYFGAKPFDIDSFLRMPPAKQAEKLIELSGGAAHIRAAADALKTAMEKRKKAKEVAEYISARVPVRPGAEPPIADIELVAAEYAEELARVQLIEREAGKINAALLDKYNKELIEITNTQENLQKIKGAITAAPKLRNLVSFEGIAEFEAYLRKLMPIPPPPVVPISRHRLSELEEEKNSAYARKTVYDAYTRDAQAYDRASLESQSAQADATQAEEAVKLARAARADAIRSIALPDGFLFAGDEDLQLIYNGFPLDTQQSLSNRYIAALKLGAMLLKDLKSMHFEASALDYDNLQTVLFWGEENDLQLLVERPDYSGTTSGITYEIHQNLDF